MRDSRAGRPRLGHILSPARHRSRSPAHDPPRHRRLRHQPRSRVHQAAEPRRHRRRPVGRGRQGRGRGPRRVEDRPRADPQLRGGDGEIWGDALRRPRGPLRQGRRRDGRVGRWERPPRPRDALPEARDAHLRRQAVRVLAGRRQGDVPGGDGVARPLDVELEPPVRPRGRRRAGRRGGGGRGHRRLDLRAGPDATEEPRALPLRDPPGRDALHADGTGLHAADLPQPARRRHRLGHLG